MRKITLVTGGCRSGKSRHALTLGEARQGPRLFVATCPNVDEEMETRIARHREERDPAQWTTVEEETQLARVIRRESDHHVILVDCLTLWVNNLMFHARGLEVNEEQIQGYCEGIVAACNESEGRLILVTNELGMGIVPADAVTRRYRDLVGRCNQTFASHAAQVILMVAGLPMSVK